MNMDARAFPSPPGQRLGVTDRVTELFHEEIRSGRWAVGSRIPVEQDLVAWTGAGRNSIREAIQSLAQSGLVRREQGRGTFVTARSQLERSLSRRVASSESARRDGLELRRIVDASAASLAAARRTPEDIVRLQRLLAERADAWTRPDLDERVSADIALHQAVVDATHNALIAELYEGLVDLFRSVLRADVEGEHDAHAAHHQQLIDSIVAGDAAAASLTITELLDPMISAAEGGETPL
jgi:DNA-binding FadR family transcriptional regulator